MSSIFTDLTLGLRTSRGGHTQGDQYPMVAYARRSVFTDLTLGLRTSGFQGHEEGVHKEVSIH